MPNANNTELVAGGLGMVVLGAGSGFALLPGLAARAFGITPPASVQPGSLLVIRALGFRDLAFGIGLLTNRKRPETSRTWLLLFSFCMAGDTLACLLALRKPGTRATALLGGLASLAFGVLAFRAGQPKEKTS